MLSHEYHTPLNTQAGNPSRAHTTPKASTPVQDHPGISSTSNLEDAIPLSWLLTPSYRLLTRSLELELLKLNHDSILLISETPQLDNYAR